MVRRTEAGIDLRVAGTALTVSDTDAAKLAVAILSLVVDEAPAEDGDRILMALAILGAVLEN